LVFVSKIILIVLRVIHQLTLIGLLTLGFKVVHFNIMIQEVKEIHFLILLSLSIKHFDFIIILSLLKKHLHFIIHLFLDYLTFMFILIIHQSQNYLFLFLLRFILLLPLLIFIYFQFINFVFLLDAEELLYSLKYLIDFDSRLLTICFVRILLGYP